MTSPTTTFATKTAVPQPANVIILTTTYYATFLALGMIMMALGATLTELAHRTNSQFREISYSFMFRSMGFILGSIFGGRIYDRLRGHKVLASALFLMAFSAAFVPVIPNLWVLIFLFLFQGLVGSLVNIGGNMMLLWTHQKNIGALLTGLHFSWGLGSAISPLIVEQVEKISGNINWAYWVLSLSVLPVCFFLLRLPSPDNPHTNDGESKIKVNLLLAILVGCSFFLYTGFEASLINWIHTYTTQTGLGDKSAAYKLNSVFLLLFTFGRLLSIPIAARLRPRTILICDFCGCILSVAAILIWPAAVNVLWVACCTLGLSMASIFPTMLAFAERRMTLSGKLTGYLFSAASGGSMILPWIVGQFFVAVGPQVLFYLVLTALFTEAGIFTVMMIRYQSHSNVKSLPHKEVIQ